MFSVDYEFVLGWGLGRIGLDMRLIGEGNQHIVRR